MKRFILFLGLMVLGWQANAQNPIITGIVDACGSDGKFVELYVSGTVDFTNYKLVRRSNSNDWASGVDIDISSLGSRTDEFVYVCRNIATLGTEFPSAGISAANAIVDSEISHNGDDSYRLVEIAGAVVIDQFGGDTDGTGEAWEYVDSWAFRNSGTVANGSFVIGDWTFGALDVLDNFGLCNDPLNSPLEAEAASVGAYMPPAPPTTSVTLPGPYAVANPLTNVINVNDAANSAGFSPLLYDSFEVTADWISTNNAWSVEADIEVVTAGGSTSVDPPTSGGASNGGATVLTFTGDFNGLYDPATDGTLDLILNQSFTGSSADWSNIVITLFEAPTCPDPSGLSVTNITGDSATLNWNVIPNASQYLWEIYNSGDVPGTDPQVDSGTTGTGITTAQTTGLMPVTDYDFYIIADCDSDGFSIRSAPVAFTTACATQVPDYLETFDTFTPDCWEQAGSGDPTTGPSSFGSSGWINDEYLNGPSEQAVRLQFNSNSDTEWAISPIFDLTAGGYQLDLDIGLTDSFNSNAPITSTGGMVGDDEVQLLYSINGGPWTNLFTWNSAESPAGNNEQYVIDLTPVNGQNNVQFAMWGNEGANDDTSFSGPDQDYDFFFDNFQVRTIPACADITNLTTTNILSDGAVIDFDDVAGAVDYSYNFGPTPYVEGSNASVTVTDSEIILSGLTPETEYQLFVQSNCTGGSGTSASITFTTACAVFVAPFSETFDATTIPNCWSQSSTTGGPWDFDGIFWNTSGCGSAPSDHTGNAGNFASMDFSGSDVGVILELPDIDVSALTVPYLEFYHFMCGSGYTPLNETYIEAFDGTTWNQVGLVNSGSASWEVYGFDLSGFVFNTNLVRLRFRAESGGSSSAFFGDVALDDISVMEAPSCITPTNLMASNMTSSGADLSWDASSTELNGYEWVVMAAGDAPDTATAVATGVVGTGVLTANVTGLLAVTSYDAYVRTDCGSGDLSDWSTAASFTTLCDVFVAPYNQDFENAGNIPNCFSNTSSTSREWSFATSATFGNSFNDNTSGSGYFALLDASTSPAVTDDATLTTPLIDISGLTSPILKFYVHHYVNSTSNTSSNQITVDVWDGAAWNQVYFDDNGDVNGWQEVVVDLNTLTITGDIQVRFVGNTLIGTNFNNDLGIDDVSIDEAPACFAPQNLMVTNIASSSADLSWDASSTETNGYEWVVMAAGDAPDTATAVATGVVGTGVLTANVAGLLAETSYDAYVRTDCGSAFSDWSSMASFTTPCAIVVPDYLESFDAYLPNCWTEAGSGDPTTGPSDLGNSLWVHDQFLNGSGSNNSVNINLYTTNREDWLISPSFDLSGGTYELKYVAAITAYANSNPPDLNGMGSDDEVQVLISTDNGATWINLVTYNQSSFPSATGDVEIFDLSAYTGVVQFAFWATDGSVNDVEDYDFFIDEFEVRTPPACPQPTDLAVTSVTPTTVDFSWTDNAAATLGYVWEIYESGDVPGTDPVVDSGSTAAGITTAQSTVLSAETSYDIYVGADCDTNGTSTVAGPVTFTTPIAPVIVNPGAVESDTYCYNNSDFKEWLFQSSDGSPLQIVFNQGSLEDSPNGTYDDLVIYDGIDDTGAVLFDSDLNNTQALDLTGLTLIAQSGSIYMTLTSDGSVSCGSGSETAIAFDVSIYADPASVQIIHNSADPSAQFVDVYVNGVLTLDNFEFRTSTPYVDLPAGQPVSIDVAPSTSVDVTESVYNLTTTLTSNESYVVVANGVLDPSQFDNSVNTPIAFNLDVFAGSQQTSTNPGETSLLINHGATDAPAVDAVEISVPAGTLVNDLAYSQFTGYADVATLDFLINVETADNSGLVATYAANLAALATNDIALTVVASGFLNPAANQNGAAFGLWAALPSGGALVELPVVEPATAAPDPTEAASDVISLFSGVYSDVTVDTFLTPWSNSQLNDVQVQGNDTKRYHALDFAGIETVANPVDASSMDFFHIDVWSPNATTFRVKLVNDLGGPNQVEGEIAFSIASQQWVSLQIPLNDFADASLVTDPNNLLTGRDSIAQYIISGLPVGAVVAYVDNIYFSDDQSISTTVFDKNNFSFYPSPAKNNLYLQSSLEVEQVKVFNMLGQEVITETPNTLTPAINVEALQTGTYIMSVTIEGETKAFRFLKE